MHIRPTRHYARRTITTAAVTAVAAAGLVAAPTSALAAPAVAPAAAPGVVAGLPVAPFVTDVVAIGLGLAVSWNPSPSTEQVTGYSITATPKTTAAVAGCTPVVRRVPAPASDSQVVVAGLCAEVLYVVRMTATNAAGTSPATPAWSPVAPLVAQVPAAPAVTAVTPRDGQAVVSWAAPVDTGGLPVIGYLITATPTTAATGTTPTSSVTTDPDARTIILTELANGTGYTINVVAVSSVGPSAAGTITVTPRPVYAPTAPTGLTATPGSATAGGVGTITVSWAAPADNGGAPVTGYTLTWQQAAYNSTTTVWRPATGATIHTATVALSTDPAAPVSYVLPAAGFEQPTAFYLFTVAASNAAGTGTPADTDAGVTPTVKHKNTAIVLTAATLTALEAADSTTLTWANPAPTQIRNLKVGQTVIADTTNPLAPHGFLRKITAISGDSTSAGNNTVLTTTDGALPDVFGNAALSADTNPVAAGGSQPGGTAPAGPAKTGPTGPAATPDAGRFTPAQAGVTVRPNATVGFGKSLTLAVDISTGPVSVKGSVTVDASVSVDVNLSTGAFGIPNGVRLTAAATVTAQAQLSAAVKGEKRVTLGYITGAPTTVFVGPVPVVIVPLVPIDLVLSGEISVGVTVGVTVGASLSWDSKTPTKLTTKNLSMAPDVFGFPFGATGTFTGSLGLAAKPSASIYALAGPQIDTELDLQAEVNWLNPSPQNPFLKIGPALTLRLGLALRIVGFKADAHATLGKTTYTAFTLTTAPTAAYTITPTTPSVAAGTTVQLQATRTDGGTSKIAWGITGGTTKDKISASGLFTAGSTAGRTLTATASDNTGANGQTRITVGTPFDPPNNPQATANTDGSATVAWAPPTNTGGAPVKSYTVITTPDTGVHTVPATATSTTIPGIAPGAYVAIYATNQSGSQSPAATAVATIDAAVGAASISAGVLHSCAALLDGTVKCWGDDSAGQLGDGTTGDPEHDHSRRTPVQVVGIDTAVAVSVGGFHSCALLSDGSVSCWGQDDVGQLGDGTTGDVNGHRLTPVRVGGVHTATAITAGLDHACALLADHTVRCWGTDGAGELGDGTTGDVNGHRLTPVRVRDVHTATAITAGASYTCAVLASGTALCWGDNYFGEIGDGTTVTRLTPTQVSGVTAATAISAGRDHTCARLADQTVRCWGSGGYGELGDGTTGDRNGRRLTPVQVRGITTSIGITSGLYHSCALLADHSIRCWGSNSIGQIGDGTTGAAATHTRLAPTMVIGMASGVAAVTAGDTHTCALRTDHTVSCWGEDRAGELGDGTLGGSDGYRPQPVRVVGL